MSLCQRLCFTPIQNEPTNQPTNKPNKEKKKISSESYTNSEEHITANNWSLEKEKKLVPDTGLGGLLS
jgi:hypothetical protein